MGKPGWQAARPRDGHGDAASFGDGPWRCQSPRAALLAPGSLGTNSPARNYQLLQCGQILLSV